MAIALTLLEEETCSHCGTPAWLGHSTDRNITFEIDSTTCYGCAEVEKDQENDRRGNRKKPKGEFRFPVARNVWADQSLPSRAELYNAEEDKG